MDYVNDFETLSFQFNAKEAKKLQLPLLIRLAIKLRDNNIEDEKVQTVLSDLLQNLNDIYIGVWQQKRIYTKAFKSLISYVKKRYGFIAKGSQIGLWIALGIALGPVFGVALIASNPAFIGVGTGIGLAIGVAIGTSFEKKAEREGKIY